MVEGKESRARKRNRKNLWIRSIPEFDSQPECVVPSEESNFVPGIQSLRWHGNRETKTLCHKNRNKRTRKETDNLLVVPKGE